MLRILISRKKGNVQYLKKKKYIYTNLCPKDTCALREDVSNNYAN